MSEIDELRARVAQACRVLGALGLAKGATGHASARLPGTDRVFIRARGPGELGVRFTTTEQVVEVGLDGKLVHVNDQGLEAPLEVFIHTALYKARPEVQAVVHVHPLPVVLFTICRKPLLPLYGAYDPSSAKLAFKGIPTYPRSILCDTPERGDELAAAMGKSDCCMMRGHGVSTAGVNVEEAALTAIHLTNPTFKADVTTAFAPISMIEDRPILFAATTSKPYKNFAELIDYARKNPGALNYAAGGTSDAIGAAWLFQLAGIKAELVRFQGGAPAVAATAAGSTDLTLTFMAQVKGHVDAGRMRAMAITGPKRVASMPNVPAVAEMFPGYAWTSFTGLLAPAGTPRPVIDKLNQAVRKSLEDAEVKKMLEAQDTVPTPSTPEEYGQYIARIRSTFTRIAQEAKVVM